MKILVSGAKGFIGSRLCKELSRRGEHIVRLARPHSKGISQDDVVWDYQKQEIDLQKLESLDVVIHLAGENIMGRWTAAKKHKIASSRAQATEFLARSISKLNNKPKVFISASAIGVYGNSGGNVVDETSPLGHSFLADVCSKWENSCESAVKSGIRVANLRISMVLDKSGGALLMMLPAFKFGLGGRLGSGKQWMSWITLNDLIIAIIFVIDNDISGPVNACSPNPVTNRDFTRILSEILHRPAIIPVPAAILNLLGGQMAREVLLSSCRACPQKLLDAGFEFSYPDLQTALQAAI